MNEHETSDLLFAAYVMTMGHALSGTEREGRRMFFEFTMDDQKWNELQISWANRTGKVIAWEYAEKTKVLKSLVHHRV